MAERVLYTPLNFVFDNSRIFFAVRMNRCYSAKSSQENLEIIGMKYIFVHSQVTRFETKSKLKDEVLVLSIHESNNALVIS